MAFDFEKSRRYLVCPKCHSDLVMDGDFLVCSNSGDRLRFTILEDIPRLLTDEAEQLPENDWREVMQRAGCAV